MLVVNTPPSRTPGCWAMLIATTPVPVAHRCHVQFCLKICQSNLRWGGAISSLGFLGDFFCPTYCTSFFMGFATIKRLTLRMMDDYSGLQEMSPHKNSTYSWGINFQAVSGCLENFCSWNGSPEIRWGHVFRMGSVCCVLFFFFSGIDDDSFLENFSRCMTVPSVSVMRKERSCNA